MLFDPSGELFFRDVTRFFEGARTPRAAPETFLHALRKFLIFIANSTIRAPLLSRRSGIPMP
jgi:hypothetical protein